MTSELSNFAARLRESVLDRDRSPVAAVPNADPVAKARTFPSIEPAADGDRPRSEDEFVALATELFKLQFAHNPVYRRVCEAGGASPDTARHWRDIPAVPTAAFKEFDLTCLPPAERTTVFHSSGTTEQRPSRHFHCADSLAVYEASLWPWFTRHVLGDFKFQISNLRLALLTPPPAQAPHSSLVHMFETVRRRLDACEPAFFGVLGGGGAWELDLPRTLACLRETAQGGVPLVLLGTAFSFVHLLDGLERQPRRFALPPGSRVMETGGYKGRSRTLPKAELHALIADRLGIPPSHIVCEYGMSELSSQAYDSLCGAPGQNQAGPPPDRAPSRSAALRSNSTCGGNPAIRTNSHAADGDRSAVRRCGESAPEARRIFRFPPWARAQIISPETGREVAEGETGLIRVFDLANVFSVMAIQTEDLGVRRGDGFELLGRVNLAEPRGCSLLSA